MTTMTVIYRQMAVLHAATAAADTRRTVLTQRRSTCWQQTTARLPVTQLVRMPQTPSDDAVMWASSLMRVDFTVRASDARCNSASYPQRDEKWVVASVWSSASSSSSSSWQSHLHCCAIHVPSRRVQRSTISWCLVGQLVRTSNYFSLSQRDTVLLGSA